MTLGIIGVAFGRWLPAREPGTRRVVFFDGVCALCDGSIRFLIRADRTGLLRFAPLQGETAAREPAVAKLIGRNGPDKDDAGKAGPAEDGIDLESIIYLRGEGRDQEVLTHSAAVLAILDDLGGFWRLLSVARIVPAPIRDRVYDFIARHRYRWFGRFEACRLPREGEAELFLD